MSAVLEVNGLLKAYSGVHALDGALSPWSKAASPADRSNGSGKSNRDRLPVGFSEARWRKGDARGPRYHGQARTPEIARAPA